MDNNNNYTFEQKQRYVMEVLDAFQIELEEKLQENKGEVERIKYFEKIQINGISFDDIFVTVEKDVDGEITYHMYSKSASKEIAHVGKDGKVHAISGLEGYLDDLNLEEILEKEDYEKGTLVGISRKATKEEEQQALQPQEDEPQEEVEEEEINNQLEEQGEDLEITKYRKIKDPYVQERMPEQFDDKSEENGIAYSNKLHKFVMIEKVDGKARINERIEPAQMLNRSVISIDENGEKMERNVPYSLMRTNDPEKEVAVNIDPYGDVNIETVQVTPCQERIARGVQMENEGVEKQESYWQRYDFEKSGEDYQKEMARQFGKVEKEQKENDMTPEGTITEDNIVPNTQVTWRQLEEATGKTLVELVQLYNGDDNSLKKDVFEDLPEIIQSAENYNISIRDIPTIIQEAKADKVSVSEFMRHLQGIEAATLEEKIEMAHEEIAEEYGVPSRNR